ncbi:hypothetical protein PV682_27685 [Streptomyces niveiscabiei]|uniref:hypothetical protein n=1 Tax=Streptomyces niveiscabiei TaxID=164115 RepID=UPI0029AB6A4B|nr:hypothetical protein [Streptomyces niveiscabiei]MDX3385229.1 hypothetical protein [Streptomyces niveiscabiei]
MATLVVGFRLGNDASSWQATVLVTESGVLHRAHGMYGKSLRLSKPEPSRALASPLRSFAREHPLARPIADLRKHHADYLKRGYSRLLIPPAVVRLDIEEYPPLQAVPHRELIEAFIGAAPNRPQPLDTVIGAFRSTLGLPTRPANVPWAPRPQSLPPRVEVMLRALERGSSISAPQRLPVGWTVTGDEVRLHVGRTGETLDRRAVIELQAALSAWLRFTDKSTGAGSC